MLEMGNIFTRALAKRNIHRSLYSVLLPNKVFFSSVEAARENVLSGGREGSRAAQHHWFPPGEELAGQQEISSRLLQR